MKIILGGIIHETNTFSTLRTRAEDFQVKRGNESLSEEPWRSFKSVRWGLTLIAYAPPHGLVEKEAYLNLKSEMISYLRDSLPADGILLDLHGAMEVEGIGSGEVDLVRDVREIIGEDIPVAASLDLHGNISRELADETNVLTAFRTAPHRDVVQTKARALKHLIKCIKRGLKPVNVLVKVPMILPGEFAVTEVEPAKTLYSRLYEIERMDGIIDASILIGCAWSDTPNTSLSILVVAAGRNHIERARELAEGLALEVWAKRMEFTPEATLLSAEEAVREALKYGGKPVVISDAGDNVTAGGAGDTTILLEELLQAGVDGALVDSIVDPEAVFTCSQTGEGSKVSLELGGKLDRVNSRPISVKGTVKHVDYPKLAVVKVDGVEVIITTKRRVLTTLGEFRETGINPLRKKIIAVKVGYLFSDLRRIARKSIWALTPGFTSLEIEKLPYRRVKRPIYPLDGEFEFYEL